MEDRRERNLATMVRMKNRRRSVTLKYECNRHLGNYCENTWEIRKGLNKYDMEDWI